MLNTISGNEYLQFKCELWRPNTPMLISKQDNITEITTYILPHFNMEFFWNDDGKLEFQFHRKSNQKLKYISKGGRHTNAAFSAIPIGVFRRLTKNYFSNGEKRSN